MLEADLAQHLAGDALDRVVKVKEGGRCLVHLEDAQAGRARVQQGVHRRKRRSSE